MRVSHTPGPEPVFALLFVLFAVFVGLAILAFSIFLYCRIFSKTGYPWALGFLILVPFGNIIILCILAFGDWPALQQLRQLQGGST